MPSQSAWIGGVVQHLVKSEDVSVQLQRCIHVRYPDGASHDSARRVAVVFKPIVSFEHLESVAVGILQVKGFGPKGVSRSSWSQVSP